MNTFAYLRFSCVVLLLSFSLSGFAQEEKDYFITMWNLSNINDGTIEFYSLTTGEVNYTWEASPKGESGSGTFNASESKVTITNLPPQSIIKLKLAPQNLKRFYFESSFSNYRYRLIRVAQWGTANWSSMKMAFYECRNLNISATDLPNLSGVNSMYAMFYYCDDLNGPTNINQWNTQTITDMGRLFTFASSFNQPIGNWNTQNVIDMGGMFIKASSFNQPIGNWNTGNVNNFSQMFYKASSFNQPIGNWNTGNVNNFSQMFYEDSSFNQPIGNWNTGNVNNFSQMFHSASAFNQPIGNWNTGNVTNMDRMFNRATSFNQPLGNWNTENVTDMYSMFDEASSFNQPLGNWNTSKVIGMTTMFRRATSFNQRLDSLELNRSVSSQGEGYMLDYSGIDCKNYSYTLIGWANNPNTPSNRQFGAAGLKYTSLAQSARDILTKPVAEGGKGWTIVGDALSQEDCGIVITGGIGAEHASMSLYPNVTQDKLYLKNAAPGAAYKIIDRLGRELLSGQIRDEEISVSSLSAGIYTLLYGTAHFTFLKE